jgi:hypothetical protein
MTYVRVIDRAVTNVATGSPPSCMIRVQSTQYHFQKLPAVQSSLVCQQLEIVAPRQRLRISNTVGLCSMAGSLHKDVAKADINRVMTVRSVVSVF